MTDQPAPARGEFTVQVRTLDGVDHVVVGGELDLSTTSTLRQAVLDPAICSQPVLLIDLARTHFIDSSGVAGLVVCHRKTISRNATFVIACPEGFTLQVLDMVGLPSVLDIHPDAETYLATRDDAPDDGWSTRQVWDAPAAGTMRTRGSAHLLG